MYVMGPRKWTAACAIIVVCLGMSPSAKAAEPDRPSVTDVTSGAAPDIVMLKNGGMVRGTISEMVPGDYVVIVTLTGETRRFAMADVSYAGSAAASPQSKPLPERSGDDKEFETPEGAKYKPEITVHAKEARLRLTSEPTGLTFHKRTSSAMAVGSGGSAIAAGFQEICTSPCEASLPAGTHTLALSEPGKVPISADSVTLPAGVSTLSGRFIDRSGIRTLGLVVVVASAVGGTFMLLNMMDSTQTCSGDYCYDNPEIDVGMLVGGLVVVGVGIPMGLALATTRDKAELTVSPAARSRQSSTGARTASIGFSGQF
jgi:hypothetical protein